LAEGEVRVCLWRCYEQRRNWKCDTVFSLTYLLSGTQSRGQERKRKRKRNGNGKRKRKRKRVRSRKRKELSNMLYKQTDFYSTFLMVFIWGNMKRKFYFRFFSTFFQLTQENETPQKIKNASATTTKTTAEKGQKR